MLKKLKSNSLLVVIFTVFIDLLGFSIVIPILAPLIAAPFGSPVLPGIDINQRLIIFGLLVGVYPIAQFIASPIIGQLSDRYGRKPLLIVSLIGTLLSRLLFIYGIVTNNIYILFVSRAIDGITGGNISVAQSAIADLSTPENKVKNFGLVGAAFGLGFLIGPYLGGKLGDPAIVESALRFLPSWIASSSTLPLWFATILCAINILLVFTIFPETIKEKIKKAFKASIAITNFVIAFKIPVVKWLFVTVFLFTFGFTFYTQYLSVYITNKFEPEIMADAVLSVNKKIENGKLTIPEEINLIPSIEDKEKAKLGFLEKQNQIEFRVVAQQRSADVFSYIGLWIIISQGFLTRFLAKRFKPKPLIILGLFGNGLSILLFLLPTQLFWLYFLIPIFSLSNGLIGPNLQALISNSADKKSQGEILGANQSVSALAQALPPLISGFVALSSIGTPIIVAGSFVILAGIVFKRFYRPTKEKVHEI